MKRKKSAATRKLIRKLARRGGCWAVLLAFSSSAWAQVDRSEQPEPDSELGGVPFSTVIRDEGAPYESVFRRITVGPTVEPGIGEGGQGRISLGAFARPDFDSPFGRGFRPEEAELKLGPFYLDVNSVSAGLLFSDNINRSELNHEEDVIGIMRLHTTALLQLTENIRFAISGVLVYLPFENEIGIAGFGADDFFARFDYGPIGRAQVSYDLKLADWEILFFDELSVRYLRPVESVDFDAFDEGVTFDEEDRAGEYVYRARGRLSRDADQRERNRRGLDEAFVGVRNTVGAVANTLLPTVTRLTLGADHFNQWYFDKPRNLNLLETRDQLYAALVSERETMRFKPYATFRTSTTDLIDGWRKEAHTGLFGPVTDNMFFRGDVGYFWGAQTRDSFLWLLSLRHTPHPRMFHELRYTKRVIELDDDYRETLSYRLNYRFSEDLYVDLFGSISQYDDIQSNRNGTRDERAGIRFTYDLAQRTTLRLGSVFSQTENESPRAPDVERWTHRAELLYRHTDTLHARLLYQHQIRDSNVPLDSYIENLVVLTLTKYF